MSAIFISYRRADSQGFAGRLEDDLSERFGEDQVFRDREIPPGTDFVNHLEAHLAKAEVVLVVIGRGWLDARDAGGERRLDSTEDWVRREIECALKADVAVVPVVVGGAKMPAAAQLPASIAALSRRQAFELSDKRWSRDLDELAQRLVQLAPRLRRERPRELRPRPPAPVPQAPTGPSLASQFASWLARRLGKLFGVVMTLAVIYILVRALGGAEANRMLDKIIATVIDQFRAPPG